MINCNCFTCQVSTYIITSKVLPNYIYNYKLPQFVSDSCFYTIKHTCAFSVLISCLLISGIK